MPKQERHDTLEDLEKRLGYRFVNRALLDQSMRHPSLLQTGGGTSYQRLEFLGDAVLQLILSEALFTTYPDDREGMLSRRRSVLTKGAFLVTIALELGIDRSLQVSPAEESAGGRTRASSLEDGFEALVGAIYVDGGFDAVRPLVLRWYGPLATRLDSLEPEENPKGRLQELVQPLHGNSALHYELHRLKGAPHERRFEIHLYYLDRKIAEGHGGSKKEAEENAARAALASWPPET